MPLLPTALAVLMFAGSGSPIAPSSATAQNQNDRVLLTLSSQTVWQGEHGWCTFSASILNGEGGLSYRCGGAGPFGTAAPGPGASDGSRRKLTGVEAATLRKLYEEARLFDGGHVGVDSSWSDMPFFILMVRSMARERGAVVLVVSGNPTFSSGPRKALLDWLLGQRAAMP